MKHPGEDFADEALYRAFVGELRGYAMIILDPEGHVMTWNEGARKIKGWEASEIIGRHFSAFYTPEANAVGHPDRELAAASSSGSYSEEGWRVRANRGRFRAHITITALHAEDGELRGFGKVTSDLTERRQIEDQTTSTRCASSRSTNSRTDFLTGRRQPPLPR